MSELIRVIVWRLHNPVRAWDWSIYAYSLLRLMNRKHFDQKLTHKIRVVPQDARLVHQ
jgi:hypothetical protein